MPTTKIKTTRLLPMTWDTAVLVNEDSKHHSYQMTIPARAQEDGTTLGWVLNYGKPDRQHLHAAIRTINSYRYLLSADITTEEAINRLRCLRREYQSQPGPKPVKQSPAGGDCRGVIATSETSTAPGARGLCAAASPVPPLE